MYLGLLGRFSNPTDGGFMGLKFWLRRACSSNTSRLLILFATLAVATISTHAQPGWFDQTAQAGFLNVKGFYAPDYYQHQGYVGDVTSDWESEQYFATSFPQVVATPGWCRQTAITDALAYWENNGYPGLVQPNTIVSGNPPRWQAGYTNTILDLVSAMIPPRAGGPVIGLKGYLENKYAADQAGPKNWKTKLLFNEFFVNTQNGEVQTEDGEPLKEEDGTSTTAFNTYARALLNGQSAILTLMTPSLSNPMVGTNNFSPTLWWSFPTNGGGGSFHAVAGAGVDLKNSQIFFADPDSNKGNKSADAVYKPGTVADATAGNGGWVTETTDPSMTPAFALVEAEQAATTLFALALNAKFTNVFDTNGLTTDNVPAYWNGARIVYADPPKGGGTFVTVQKGNDANVNNRKFTAADVNVPFPAAPKPGTANSYNQFYGTFTVDASGFKVTESDDKDGNITSTGRYVGAFKPKGGGATSAVGVQFVAVATIGPKTVEDSLKPVPNANGLKKEIKIVSAMANPVDKIQIAPVSNVAVYDPTIDGQTFYSTFGSIWMATYLPPGTNSLDGFGNTLTNGGWGYVCVSTNNYLSPFDPLSLTNDILDTFVETDFTDTNGLTQYHVLEHVPLLAGVGTNQFGDYWTIQVIGGPETIYGAQQNNTLAALLSSVSIALSIQQSGTNVIVSWPGGGTLQSAPEAIGPWTDITGATSPYVTPAREARAFYRVGGQ